MKVQILPRIPNGDECKTVEHTVFRTVPNGFESRRPFQSLKSGYSQGVKGGGLQIRYLRFKSGYLLIRLRILDCRFSIEIRSPKSQIRNRYVVRSLTAEHLAVNDDSVGSNPIDPPILILDLGLRILDLIFNPQSAISNPKSARGRGRKAYALRCRRRR